MRWEYKYLVPDALLPALRSEIAPFVQLDAHGLGYEQQGYTIRSIYLDTPTLACYHEKLDGLRERRKLRIRGYNQPRGEDLVFLEIKRKIGSVGAKHRAPVYFEDVQPLLTSGQIHRYVRGTSGFPEAYEDAGRFLFHVCRYSMCLVNLVVYEREAFVGRFDPTLRVTMDRNLRGGLYPAVPDLYQEEGLRKALPGHFILEVKFDIRFPVWLKPLIGRYELKLQALSKYVLCLDLYGGDHQSKGTILARGGLARLAASPAEAARPAETSRLLETQPRRPLVEPKHVAEHA